MIKEQENRQNFSWVTSSLKFSGFCRVSLFSSLSQ